MLRAVVNSCLKSQNRSRHWTISRPCFTGWVLALVAALASIAIAQGPSDRQSDLIAEASAARMQNDVPRAIELYSKAVAQNPKWADGWWFLGSLQYGTGDYAPAREALSHYVEMMPTAGPAFALRGLCEFETGDYSPALADIQHGISLGAANQPRNEQILRYHVALLQTRLGNYSAALKEYGFFAKNGVTNPELLIAIGLAGLRIPLLPKEVTQQQELASTVGDAAYRFMSGDEDSARHAFQELFQRFPAAQNAHFLYGYLLLANDPYAALTEFQEELKVFPANVNAEVLAAWALLLQNANADALPYAQTAVNADPKQVSAQLVLGKSLVELGDIQRGLEHLETALQLEPNNLETHLALAKAYSKSGRKDDARRERLLCLQLTRGNGTTTEHQ